MTSEQQEKDKDPEEVRKRLLQQTSTKHAVRNNRLRVMYILYIIIFLSIAILQFIALAFFQKGFLLSRPVLDNYSTLADDIFQEVHQVANFDKAVVIIIDALRFDFVIPDPESNEFYHNNLKLPYKLSVETPQNSVLLKFIADPPTTTLQRLKGLTTGSLPTFGDAFSNFDGEVIKEDNLIKQLYQHNRSITFIGDDTWEACFGPYLHTSYPYDSLNVWDLHTVDNGVIEHMIPLLHEKEQDWDLLIGHLLGVDHCGHRYGPDHPSMKDKQEQMDEYLQNVIDLLDDKTLLVVLGDHGMDRTGNHGGDSQDELEATLWLYSKQKSFNPSRKQSVYDTANNGANYKQVNQIDLVPTLSLLLGLPIPFNNLGTPISEAFKDNSTYEQASYITLQQVQRYRAASSSLKDDVQINAKYEKLLETWTASRPDFLVDYEEYQNSSLERCKDLWTRFDMLSIYIGITLFALSFLILIAYSKLIPSVVISQLSEEIVPSVLAMISLFTVIFIAIALILKPTVLNLTWFTLLGVATGIVLGFAIPILDRYSPIWLFLSFLDLFRGFWTLIAFSFATIHAITFASNSFTIWEERILSYLLITFGFIAALKSLESKDKLNRVMGVYHGVSFMLITRIASLITTCREEQGDQCTPTFKITWWSIGFIFFNSQFMPSIIKAFYNISGSFQGAAILWIKYLKVTLFLIGVYWALDHFERTQSEFNIEFLRNISLKSVHFTKFTLARVIFGVTFIAANFGWSRGPLCIRLDIKRTETSTREACILGYGNAYGSQYFLLVINAAAVILLFTKPMGQISIFFLVYQVLALSELVNILDIRTNLISPVVLGVLGGFHFFTTGHQATIPSINWELAFSLTETIVFPFSHIPIALNTFGSFIIIGISVALITLWRITPSVKPVSLYSRIIENCGTLLAYQSIVTLSTLIFATVFRRHLMVWKIFAPRYMFAAMVQIVLDLVLVLITIGFATGRLILQINKLFGK